MTAVRQWMYREMNSQSTRPSDTEYEFELTLAIAFTAASFASIRQETLS